MTPKLTCRQRLDRISRYVMMRRLKPMRSMDDVIHGIHMGEEWEAELCLSDIDAAVALFQEMSHLILQYRNDLVYSLPDDSKIRRLEMIQSVLNQLYGEFIDGDHI